MVLLDNNNNVFALLFEQQSVGVLTKLAMDQNSFVGLRDFDGFSIVFRTMDYCVIDCISKVYRRKRCLQKIKGKKHIITGFFNIVQNCIQFFI